MLLRSSILSAGGVDIGALTLAGDIHGCCGFLKTYTVELQWLEH